MRTIKHDRPFLALSMRLAGIAGFGIMATLIKLASERGIHLVEIIFWRQFLSIPVLIALLMLTSGLGTLRTKRPWAHFNRGVMGLLGMIFNFGALILLPLAEATTFSFTAPIFAVILSVILLSEKVGIWRVSSVLAGFAGILIIIQPGSSNIPLDGAAVAIIAALLVALISIQLRDLSQTDSPLSIVFWMAVMTSLCALPVLPFYFHAHTTTDWLILLGIGLSGTWGQTLITFALRFGKVSSVIIMDYSAIIWATLFGWLVFATLPTVYTWIGAPIVVAAGVTIAWRERTVSKRKFVDQRQA